MKRIMIKALYAAAHTAPAEPLMFNNSLVSKLPSIVDDAGNTVDCDFITYYNTNYALFDRYIKYLHGAKIYKYDEEEFESGLAAWKDHIEALMFANIDEFANMFAKETIAHKYILGNRVYKEDILGERTGEKKYGQDKTEYDYAQDKTDYDYAEDKTTFDADARHSEALSPQKSTTTDNYNKAYDSGDLTQTTESVATSDTFTDEMDQDAYQDVTTRDSRKDTTTRAAHKDTTTRLMRTDEYTDDETTNTSEILDNHQYYQNMAAIPAFEDCMKRILNKLVIESGVSYDY